MLYWWHSAAEIEIVEIGALLYSKWMLEMAALQKFVCAMFFLRCGILSVITQFF